MCCLSHLQIVNGNVAVTNVIELCGVWSIVTSVLTGMFRIYVLHLVIFELCYKFVVIFTLAAIRLPVPLSLTDMTMVARSVWMLTRSLWIF